MVAPVVPPIGIIYTGMSAPLDTDLMTHRAGREAGAIAQHGTSSSWWPG
jgi:hypothetical protein